MVSKHQTTKGDPVKLWTFILLRGTASEARAKLLGIREEGQVWPSWLSFSNFLSSSLLILPLNTYSK